MNEELDLLLKKRDELIKYVMTHNLQHEKHYMKFLELQDTNFEIIKLKQDYDFKEETEKQGWWQK